MEFYGPSEGRLGVRDIPPVLADLMSRIPRWGDSESEAAEARLFPCPSTEPREEDLRADWKAHVQPELHEFFQSARHVVEADLRGMKAGDGGAFTMEFSAKHAEAWLNALNQARLALAARHNLGEEELSQPSPMPISNERDLARIQVNFYAALQQWLVEVLDGF